MKRNFKFRPKARLRVGKEVPLAPLSAAKGAVRWRNMPVRSGRALRVSQRKLKPCRPDAGNRGLTCQTTVNERGKT
jgi:hypothetical protein